MTRWTREKRVTIQASTENDRTCERGALTSSYSSSRKPTTTSSRRQKAHFLDAERVEEKMVSCAVVDPRSVVIETNTGSKANVRAEQPHTTRTSRPWTSTTSVTTQKNQQTSTATRVTRNQTSKKTNMRRLSPLLSMTSTQGGAELNAIAIIADAWDTDFLTDTTVKARIARANAHVYDSHGSVNENGRGEGGVLCGHRKQRQNAAHPVASSSTQNVSRTARMTVPHCLLPQNQDT